MAWCRFSQNSQMTDLSKVTSERLCRACDEIVRPVRIVYGLPTDATAAKARAGEFRLGGCLITGDDP